MIQAHYQNSGQLIKIDPRLTPLTRGEIAFLTALPTHETNILGLEQSIRPRSYFRNFDASNLLDVVALIAQRETSANNPETVNEIVYILDEMHKAEDQIEQARLGAVLNVLLSEILGQDQQSKVVYARLLTVFRKATLLKA